MAEIVILNPRSLEEPQSGAARSLGSYAALTIAATALVAISAHVAVPLFFTPVPITLQTLAVLFLGLALGPHWAFATLVLYLVEGAAGLPVFNPNGPGGLPQLIGPTGGYLLSYPLAAAAAGLIDQWLGKRIASVFTGRRFSIALVSALIASVLILGAGATWLAALTHQSAHAVLAQAVIPFLPGDLFKVCLAASAIAGLHRIQRPEPRTT